MLLLPALLAAALSAAQQDPVRVTAVLTADRVEVGVSTTLQITVETRGPAPDDIRVPTLPANLDILGTSEYTQTQISVPGGRSRATRREVILVARAPGVFRIGPATVVVGGRTYRTDPLDLIVSSGGATRPGSPPARSGSSLEVVLRPDTVYVGQQVLLRARATFSEEMRLRQSRPPTFDPPAPSGFWIQDVPDPVSVSLRVSEGRTVETQTYRRAYFPLSAGEFRFPPARLHYEVRRGFLFSPESRELVSDSARLVVLPLPETGRPATFTGAVGRLRLSASLSQTRVAAGEPTVLTVEVEGLGNVKALPEPRLPEIAHADVFSPSQESRVDIADDEVGGVKRFQWMIVPQRTGSLMIPPVEYGVFDPELRAYVVLRSDTLHVTATTVVTEASPDGALRGLRTAPSRRLSWVRTTGFAALQIAPVLLLFGVVQLQRRRVRPPTPREHALQARRRLAELRSTSPLDLAAVERTLCEGLLQVTGATHGDALHALRESGRTALAARLDALLHELQRARYAPGASFDAAALADRADALLRDSAVRGWWPTQRGPAAMLLLACAAVMGAAMPSPAVESAADGVDFARGLELYEAGEFSAAAASFNSWLRLHPGDASGWYNAGTAAYRAGDRGGAIWAWLRATRLAPRDGDIRHNLRVAGADAAAARVAPPDRLSTEERKLAAAIGWWLLIAGLAAVVLGGRRFAWTSAPGAALLLAAAIVVAMVTTAPRLVAPLGDGAMLHAGPAVRDENLGVLQPGSLAVIVEDRADWLLVRTGTAAGGGREAWVERAAVAALP
jgi:tetratricopeptide (TPR) repeat protein